VIRCRLASFWETVTLPAFWASLFQPPLVVVSGHLWSEPEWSEPRPSAHPDDWPGLVEVDLSHCVRCGHTEDGWRRSWMLP
jgi:hypothetical protein